MFDHFTMISSHFFDTYLYIFHKTEDQMVILRCWTGLIIIGSRVMTQNATQAKKSRSFTVGVSFWLSSYYSLSPTIKQSNRDRVKENRWKRKSKSRYIEFTPWTEHGHPTFFDRKGLDGHFLSVPSLSVPSLKRTTPRDFLMSSFMSITYQKKKLETYIALFIYLEFWSVYNLGDFNAVEYLQVK